MEYPNGENRSRIKVKTHSYCEICLEAGRTELDSTEHNLFFCECLRNEEIAATLRMEVLILISRIKNLNPNVLEQIIVSDP